ncbi:alanine racemase [Nocardioides sp. GY 10113]|uniref:alanine racemase n=1 Tax=Nocardioides sp. GY 10113 TaxID=2569761 RepID=UPI0010A94AB3|nr:alanine racemase [Nocardioides sp. GY 10113]TIC83292.1 alanine racemase [Nocardioides sp. GY 10113]
MNPTPGHPEIRVDVGAIRANARLLRAHAGVPLIAVVKADGYGHGMVESAHAALAGGADWLAVATPEEALALREAGLPGRILCWLTTPDTDYKACLRASLDVTAYSVAELDEIAEAAATLTGAGAGDGRARVQLKVDTGLSRGGAPRSEWAELFERARRGEREGSWRITGVWSHLACSDDPEHPANDAQEASFREAITAARAAGLTPEICHLANSAAAILRPSARFDAVRCGIALYGLDPAPGNTPDLGLRPAMTVRAPLVMVKDAAPGAGVSYGHLWRARRETTLGLVPLGYGDGIPRHASSADPATAAEVLVAGRRRPIRGRVCMDQFVVDLDGDRPPVGADAVLFGPGDDGEPTAQDWAEACGTINYEIVTRIGGRMSRTHHDGGDVGGPGPDGSTP